MSIYVMYRKKYLLFFLNMFNFTSYTRIVSIVHLYWSMYIFFVVTLLKILVDTENKLTTNAFVMLFLKHD